jgi:hypothetical protein
MRISHGGA